MNYYLGLNPQHASLLIIAAALTVALSLVHSILGEALIFRHWRKSPPAIPGRHRGIIQATWHLASFVAIAFATLLYQIAVEIERLYFHVSAQAITACCLGASALLVFYFTRGRHPGWVVLSIITALIALA